MEEKEFNELAAVAMSRIEAALEGLADADEVELDFELAAGGVLEVEFADGSKIIVNRHAVAREIWVAARSGGFHFRWVDQGWHDTRDGVALFARLSDLVSQQAGQRVSLAG